jgi:hypothetical protein
MSDDQPTCCREGGAIQHVGRVAQNETRRNQGGFDSLDPSYVPMQVMTRK